MVLIRDLLYVIVYVSDRGTASVTCRPHEAGCPAEELAI